VTPHDVAPTLRKVAALRALCLRLPHVPTPAEARSLARFEDLAASPGRATPGDVEAIVAGWRGWWRERRTAELAAMARALPPGLVGGDRRLAALAGAAGADPGA
jgi:hypothetical protein